MKITYRGDYALKAILDLTLNHNNVVTIHDLAKRAQIPIKFLEQVLLELKRGGFVESRRGNVGGYLLAKHPSQIRVGDIIRFIDGPLEPIACTEKDYSGCSDIYKCAFRKIFKEVAQATSDIVDNINFEELAKQVESTSGIFVYQI
ncbi:MAG: Rrf2 family transcriptional regulator [Candidatus Omnitrophica bacterium]|nr:Rrf2 family transcriptional regulator [Candidatus Omnitrophota bacterium]